MKAPRTLRLLTTAAILAGFGAVSAFGQFAATGTTNLTVNVAAEASIRIDTANTALTSAGNFADYLGTTGFTYKIRTSLAGGTGSVVLQITSDFAGAGGPSVGTPPTAGDKLAYNCTVIAPGTACSGPVTSSTSATTAVANFGTNAHSAFAGTGGNSVSWDLTNDPAYATGAYIAIATFTISAT